MDALQTLTDLARRPLSELDRFWGGLSPDRLNDHPGGHPNSIAWLLWHTGREIDAQIADLAGTRQEWNAHDWADRLGPDVPATSIGYGQSEDEARAVVVTDKEALWEYLEKVTRAATDYLDTLAPEDLDEVIDENWDPPVTRGARLVSVFADALQHVGQAGYLAGMPARY